MKKSSIRLFWPFLVLFLPLLACNFLLGSGGGSLPAVGNVDRETAVFLVGGQPQTLDPALTYGGPSDALGHIFSGLVSLDADLQIQPDLAAGWQVNEAGTVYTFYLRPAAVFHDGRPVTASDVIFSWERAADPATGSDTAYTYLGDIVGVEEMLAGEAEQISGLRALDDHSLQVTIDAPKPYFLAKLAYPVAFVVDRDNVDDPNWEHNPNGTGPFRLETWEDDEVIILARNEAWYRDPPSIPHLVYLMDAALPLARYETGEIDLVGVGGATLERVRDPNNALFEQLRTGVAMCTSYIGFNSALPPLDDPLVRQAFSYALDEQRLISGLYRGNALAATGILPPGMPGYNVREDPYPFDPEKARLLLAEAGYTPEAMPTLTFTTAGYGGIGAYVTAVITMWQENLGVEVEPILLDPYVYNEVLYGGDVGHFYSSGWCADYPDPQNFLDVLFYSGSPQNLGNYRNEDIDLLLQEAQVEPDVAQRLALYQAIEEQLLNDAPAAFVSHSLNAVLVSPRLQGYELVPIGIPQWHQVQIRE